MFKPNIKIYACKLRKLRQEDCCKFEVSFFYLVSTRPARTHGQTYLNKRRKELKKERSGEKEEKKKKKGKEGEEEGGRQRRWERGREE